jgi:hypothetical protein
MGLKIVILKGEITARARCLADSCVNSYCNSAVFIDSCPLDLHCVLGNFENLAEINVVPAR